LPPRYISIKPRKTTATPLPASISKETYRTPPIAPSIQPAADPTIWQYVSRSPLGSLWNLQGIPWRTVANRTWKSFLADNLLGRSAELGFYFLFALFPTLVSAASILGLAARSAATIYDKLLHYLILVVPSQALGTVLETFNQTTAAATRGKITFGLVAALWSASVGFSAIQEALNTVYKVTDTRPYWHARLSAIGVTLLLASLVTLILTAMLGADYFSHLAHRVLDHPWIANAFAFLFNLAGWTLATTLLTLSFAVIYYFGPDVKRSQWRWLTPGSAIGILGWLIASLGFRLYLHLFNSYTATYGSLGAVTILLMWFYLTGLMLLLGAEINSEIEAAAAEQRLAPANATPAPTATQPR